MLTLFLTRILIPTLSGATPITEVLTAGGGSKNDMWTKVSVKVRVRVRVSAKVRVKVRDRVRFRLGIDLLLGLRLGLYTC
jgi:hypothetical protein